MGSSDGLGRGLQALALVLQSIGNLAWALSPETLPRFWREFLPLAGLLPPRPASLALALGLFGLALGVLRRKRYAWTAVLGVYGLAAGFHLWSGPAWAPALLALALAAGLAALRAEFIARSHPAAVRAGARAWAILLAAALLAGAAGHRALGIEPGGAAPLWGAARAGMAFTLFLNPAPGAAAPPPSATLLLGLSALAWGALWRGFQRALPPPPPAGREDRRQAQEIVCAFGRTSMAHLTLLPDKRYFFAPGGSLVAYAVYGRVALALGDPIGPCLDVAPAILAYRRFCLENDWLPAFCLTSADYLECYRRAGFDALCLGHEGIIDLRSFSLRGNARKTLRKRYNRLTALGYRMQIYAPPIPNATLAGLRCISDEWLKMARAAEKRFFLAWFDEDYLRGEQVAVVYAPDGSICAFTSLVPEYQLNEISIDLMRRRRVESGVMDFLFVALLLWAQQQGYDSFNLGLSPLYGVGGRPGSSPLEAFINFAYRRGNFYDFKGLNGFKLKFHPRWTPQYMVYPGLLALPWVGLTMARANAGEDETLWQYFSSRPQHTRLDDPAEAAE